MEHSVPFFAEPRTWVAIAFVVFFVIFGRKLWTSMAAALDNRAMAIRAELEEAARLRAEAEALLQSAKARREAALREAQDILARAREEAARAAEQARADAEAALRRRERAAADRIHAAESAAVAEVRRAAVEVATQAATQVLAGGFGAGIDRALVDRAIVALPTALTGRRAA